MWIGRVVVLQAAEGQPQRECQQQGDKPGDPGKVVYDPVVFRASVLSRLRLQQSVLIRSGNPEHSRKKMFLIQ